MADQDWMFRTSAAILAASRSANMTKSERRQMSGLAWLQSKHRELMAMPEENAAKEFDKLDRKVQQSLEGLFGTTQYNPEELSFWGQAKKYIKKPFSETSEILTSYGEAIGRPFRALAVMDDVGSFSEAWNIAADGKRLFDADRAERVESFYGKTVSKIAKRLSMGDTIGAIVSDLETDEEFATMEKFLQGDETVTRALRDFDQSKISYGRSFAHLFNLDPEIGAASQGIEGKVFKGLSGATDLFTGIVADPATWLFAPIKAYRTASLGLMQLQRAAVGDPTVSQKIFGAISGKSFGWDEAFKRADVRKAFDSIGEQIGIAASRKADDVAKSVARQRIQQIMPSADDNMIDQFIRFARVEKKPFDADLALKFFNDKEALTRVVQGQTGSLTGMLPTAGARQGVRKTLRDAVHSITGFSRDMTRLENTAFSGSYAEKIAQGQSAAGALEVRNMNSFGRKTAKAFERALIEQSAYTGGFDELGRSMAAKSAGSIYTLARTIFNKADADMLSKMYVGAKSEGQRRKIIEGLYRTMLDSSGLTKTEDGKRVVDRMLNQWNRQTYSEAAYLSEATAKAGGKSAGIHKADDVAGENLAVAAYHVKHQIQLPSIVEIYQAVEKDSVLRSLSGIKKFNEAATDFWSALNLLPRLGLRSVLDEGLFHYLTMPITVFQHGLRGYQASITERVLTDPQGKNVGLVARHFITKLTDGVPEEQLAKARVDKNFAAELLETQLTSGILGKAIFAGNSGKRYAKYISDNVRYGHIAHIRGFSEGMSRNVATATPSASNALQTVLEVNPTIAKSMKIDKVRLGGDPTIVLKGNASFLTNAHIQLVSRVDRNDMIGKIAVANLENPELAVKKIAKYLKENPNFYKQFDRYNSSATTIESDAFNMYVHVRNMFTNDLDEINTALLKKVRTGKFGDTSKVTAANLKPEDILEVQDGFKTQLFGYGREIQVFTRFGDVVDEFINTGFEVMDRQLATLSREPAFYAYQLHYREQFAAVEKAYAKDWLKKNPEASIETAMDVAARRYSSLATDMAINRVLGYIDNPHVRSNLAFGARNVARYYRATEDFYRRAGRVLREQGPRALLRLRIANEGLEHAGFIHEDENGEKYFTFPVDEIMYNVYSPALKLLGVETRRPMPLALSGKIKMLTPSLDPESNLPTFAGPLVGAAWSLFRKIIPNEYSDTVTRGLFGQYATDASMYDALVPSTLKRVVTAFKAASGVEEEQVASATMKSMAFYAANGMAPTPQSSQAERDQYLYDVKATARSIVFLRNVLGIFSPVSPQFSAIQDVPAEVMDAGAVSLKQEFHRIVEAEQKKGNDDAWNTALRKWTKLNPGRLVYTVSEGEANTIAPIAKTKEAVEWLKNNETLARKFTSASVFLMPQAGDFDLDAYAFLKREGFIETKNLDKYFSEVTNVRVENEYYDTKRKYEDLMAENPYPETVARYQEEMNRELTQIKNANPFFKRQLEQFQGTTQLKMDAVQNMIDALDSGMVPETDTTRRIRRMIDVFNRSLPDIMNTNAQTDLASSRKREFRNFAHQQILDIAGVDRNATLFYETILKRLLG